MLARLMHAKLQKLSCACTVACDFGVRMWDSKHTRHTRDARNELALGLPHYMCGVTTGTVTVGNEIQLLAADWLLYNYEYRLIILLKRHGHTEHSRIFSCLNGENQHPGV